MKRERVWFFVDSPNTDERKNIDDFLKAEFELTAQNYGSGFRNRVQIDYYCYSTKRVREVRSAIRRHFPKSKVARW